MLTYVHDGNSVSPASADRVEKDILIESYNYTVKYLSYLQFISSVFLTRNELSALVLCFLRLLLLFKLTLFRGAKSARRWVAHELFSEKTSLFTMIPLGHSTAEEDCENPLNLLVSKV